MNEHSLSQAPILERFIPVSLDRLINDLIAQQNLTPDDSFSFQRFCSLYIKLFNAQAQDKFQSLKNGYTSFSPDAELVKSQIDNEQAALKQLKKKIYSVLNDANYEQLSESELNHALNKISPHGVKVSVDFDEFSDIALFYRGSAIKTETIKSWRHLYLRNKQIDTQIYRRLFVLIQPKTRNKWIDDYKARKRTSLKKAEKKAHKAFKSLGIDGQQEVVYLKLFKDIPKADLEMLFPNTRIQIRLFDKIKLGIMGGGGTAGGIMATISKFSAAIEPVSAILAIGGLLGVIWRQIAKIFNQRAKYSALLTKNLYFYSLDNNMGALTYLADNATAEECKEAILAYYFLIQQQSDRLSLDKKIEHYIAEQYQIPMDFEIDDGLEKLSEAGLLTEENGLFSVPPPASANTRLEQQWHQLIQI